MSAEKPQLIVALDVDTFEKAREVVDKLSPVVDIFKIGSQLFTSCGPAAARFILARSKKVFLDLKYHDIPNTVASAVSAATGLGETVGAGKQGIFMLTVHTQGGKAMMEAAVCAAKEKAQGLQIQKPLIVGITALTSDEKTNSTQDVVLQRALLAKESGLDGVVASVHEAKAIRQKLGGDFVIVTPGIRPSGADTGDQKRIATPKEAALNGSNYLVVGRPIIESADPLETAKKILEEIS